MIRALVLSSLILVPASAGAGPVLRHLGDTHVDGGLEIAEFDPAHRRVHAVGSGGRMEFAIDQTGRATLLRKHVFSRSQSWEATSLAIDPAGRGFGIVSWIPDPPDSVPGIAQVFDLETGESIWQFGIGYHPDCVVFTPDGRHLLAANECEPGEIDRVGAITVVDLSEIKEPGDFLGFNDAVTYELVAENLGAGVDLNTLRIIPELRSTPGVNIEPEYIAPTNDGAWVSLQENNGLGYFDLGQRLWTRVMPLDPLSFPFDGSAIDGFRLSSGEGFGLLPMPDTIALYQVDGRDYIVTANEGDTSEGHSMPLSDAIKNGLVDEAAVERLVKRFGDLDAHGIGQLYISTIDGDLDGDGDLDVLCPLGGRSVSIIDAQTGVVVWNSGPQIELITGMLFPELYNAADTRSTRAGPEPEGVAIGKLGQRTLLAVGLERTGVVMLYDISDPIAPQFLDAVALDRPCESPEGLSFFMLESRLLLAVAGEIGGCLSIYEVVP